MAAVNVKKDTDEKEAKNSPAECHEPRKEHRGLNLETVKYKKEKAIDEKVATFKEKLAKKKEDADWKSRLLESISLLPASIIGMVVSILMKNALWNIIVLLVLVIILILLYGATGKELDERISRKKEKIVNYEMIMYIGQKKLEKRNSQDTKESIIYQVQQRREAWKSSWEQLESLLTRQYKIRKNICRSIWIVLGLVAFIWAKNVPFKPDQTESTEQNSTVANKDNADTDIFEAEQNESEKIKKAEINEISSVNTEKKSVTVNDETEEGFEYLWNLYMGDLETYELVNIEDALPVAKQFCRRWINNNDIKDTDQWAYTDMEVYSLREFETVFLKEKNLLEKNNVNGSILLEVGKSYSISVDEFLEANGDDNVTERTVGIACLRGMDIYMSVLRHKVTRKSIKEECYKGVALLLREFADEVYEKQKYKEVDKREEEEYSAKEFVLYTYSAVCYENAAEYGNPSYKKEAEKMKIAAEDNWKAFKKWVP